MFRKLILYTKGCRGWILLSMASAVISSIVELRLPLVMAEMVDKGIPSGDMSTVFDCALRMVLLTAATVVLGLFCSFATTNAGQGFGYQLRKAQFEHIQSFSFSNIERFSTASLVTRLTNDVNAVQTMLMMSMRIMITTPMTLIVSLVQAVRISRHLSSVFVVILPLLIVLMVLVTIRSTPIFKSMQEKTDRMNLFLQEDLGGVRVVKAYAREDHERGRFSQRNDDLMQTAMKASDSTLIFMPIMMIISHGAILAVMWLGAPLVGEKTVEVGLLSTFVTYINMAIMSLMMLSMISMSFVRSIACARRIFEVLDEEADISDAGADRELEVADGAIEFDHVSFQYNKGAELKALDDINLRVKAGSTVGIIGGTGSGKSTLVQLIPRLYEAEEGTVRVGGRPVEDYSLETLRAAVAMVLQKNTLFSGTIRENLMWGDPDATEEEIEKACEAACCREFLDRFEDGLETELGQGGVNVSGGQRQRLCIARALLKRPKVLILDDSTSAVDTATEAKIRAALRDMLPETTKIIIAQRIVSVMDADLILVMTDGRILDAGSHEELMASCELYREIYRSQMERSVIDG